MLNVFENNLNKAAELIKKSKHAIAFTGAGISVESGIPPFRGEGGIWGKYNPEILDINYFRSNLEKSWSKIREIFYEYIQNTQANPAHLFLAELEKKSILKAVITQNIDGLHQKAGSKNVLEFHGTAREMVCMTCGKKIQSKFVNMEKLPPKCSFCSTGVLKPDFIFFGEGIPPEAYQKSFEHANLADLVIVIGASGEVVPAALIPEVAKKHGAKIIEINLQASKFTDTISDIFLAGKASEILRKIVEKID
jgi:NAD-dependent deacetylase